MAGIGIGPDEFAVFEIEDPGERARAVDGRLAPRLLVLGALLQGGLSRVVGRAVTPRLGTAARRRGGGPGEAWVAFAEGQAAPRGVPYLALSVTGHGLHARVAVRGGSDRVAAMRRALSREAGNLCRRGKPFRRLRTYAGWDHEHLPEIAPASSAAFWLELSEGLAGTGPRHPPLADVGIAWQREEARSLAIGDVLGAFRDLAPVWKLLANAK
jgi:hypothetical protein